MNKQYSQSGDIQMVRLYERKVAARHMHILSQDEGWEVARVSDGRGGAGVLQPDFRNAESNLLTAQGVLVARFSRLVHDRILPAIEAEFGAQVMLPAEISAVRYPPGGRYATHVDNGLGYEHRSFSVVCYLNEDFEGGGTHFPDLGLTVSPETGMAIVFPSGYRHAATPVLSGMKYVLICWLVSPPPIKWI